MDYIFNNLDIDNIICGYAEENFKSKGLIEKIGFRFFSEHIEHYTRIDKDVKVINTIITTINDHSTINIQNSKFNRL